MAIVDFDPKRPNLTKAKEYPKPLHPQRNFQPALQIALAAEGESGGTFGRLAKVIGCYT